MKNMLFICGCSRSGTSVSTEFLNSHGKLAIGLERYGKRLRLNGRLPPGLFTKARFCETFDPDDSHLIQMTAIIKSSYLFMERWRRVLMIASISGIRSRTSSHISTRLSLIIQRPRLFSSYATLKRSRVAMKREPSANAGTQKPAGRYGGTGLMPSKNGMKV